jgi:hypothetical protein
MKRVFRLRRWAFREPFERVECSQIRSLKMQEKMF